MRMTPTEKATAEIAEIAALSPGTQVIIITGREDFETKQTALRAGAVAFFTKPFDDNQFLAAVHGALTAPQSE